MRITVLRTAEPIPSFYNRGEVNLARKLQACATGIYPREADVSSVFLRQAINLANMPETAHSVMASLEDLLIITR